MPAETEPQSAPPAGPAPAAPTGRLAPSPTGRLHVGHARTFLAAWWSARARGGRVVLRIEDLDGERCRAEFSDAILRDLEWLGLDWDGPPRLQSAGLERIEAALEHLERAGLAYACTCSRADLQRASSAPHEGAERAPAPYPGRCRGRYVSRASARAQSGTPAALRFRVPAEPPGRTVEFADLLAGPQCFDAPSELGDFVVARRDGWPAYQLAVVVDDAADGVGEVVRGEDLLASTARQWLLQAALGLAHPRWAHVPLVVDERGERLAKRTAGLALGELRAAGCDPRALVRWVAESLGQPAPEPLWPRELAGFELERAPSGPVRFGERERAELWG